MQLFPGLSGQPRHWPDHRLHRGGVHPHRRAQDYLHRPPHYVTALAKYLNLYILLSLKHRISLYLGYL